MNVLELFDPITRRWFENAFGDPTAVQKEAWPAIVAGCHTLVTAPTGTGKTLSAFLAFIDRLKAQARKEALQNELHVIYISPLKALAGDIRENLNRPLYGIADEERKDGIFSQNINIAIRTGDTSTYDRAKMVKTPPHILITTPESLYLLLTSKSGKPMLSTARVVIIDELHAMIDSKRGAHLMLSLARLDALCGHPLQRIGLSATVEPPEEAARYLVGKPINVIRGTETTFSFSQTYPGIDPSVILVSPKMRKDVAINVTAPAENMHTLPQGTIWPEIASAIYDRCENSRSVIAFVDGRMHAEKVAYYVNQQAVGDVSSFESGGKRLQSAIPNTNGDSTPSFARTHHGCVSKEQRFQAENDLRNGSLRLLVATSSMELGIDVGDIERVMQVGCPPSISSVMQRLGRAGHNPGRVSVMDMFPRTDAEGLYCGLTARVATDGRVERMHPPRLCLDVLAQHLVSMAVDDGYSVDDVMELLPNAYPFRDVTREDVTALLRMLAGDYEHRQDLPVRPRILYDRIHDCVEGDAYSRMLAVSAGGTIPDTGMFAVKTESGAKLGELDEEFVFEARVGDRFLLGSFAWKIMHMDKDTVTVAPTTPAGAQPPFWRHAWLSRSLQTGLAFGSLMRSLNETDGLDGITALLRDWQLDDAAARNTAGFLSRQLESTGGFPDDHTIIAEHFTDDTGEQQIMVHSVFGKRVNAPLSLLAQEAVRRHGTETYCFADDDGFLLMSNQNGTLPEGLLQSLKPQTARPILEALLPSTPLFNMTFRYNTGRALMMGVRKGKRQPLWVQRLRSTEMLDSVIGYDDHPLIRETKRECLEDYWDLDGLEWLLQSIQSGQIKVREIYTPFPSPMSLPLRRQAEGELLYEYFPTTGNIKKVSEDALDEMLKIKPAAEQLARVSERRRLPEDEKQLHSLMMIEGDLIAGELPLPVEWFESLASQGRALYVEPGLWIAAEQEEEYSAAFSEDTPSLDALSRIIRRALRYRGAQSIGQITERYFLPTETSGHILSHLCETGSIVIDGELYYHADLYERARHETVAARRRQVQTVPSSHFAAFLSKRVWHSAPPDEQLKQAMTDLCALPLSPAMWENVLLPARVNTYNPVLLDTILAGGEWFWQMTEEGISFHRYADIDWDISTCESAESAALALPEGDERIVYEALQKRGASFSAQLAPLLTDRQGITDTMLSLTEKGLIHADSFAPIRQWLAKSKIEKAPPKRQISARVQAMTSGRWELSRPLTQPTTEQWLEQAFDRYAVVCRETVRPMPWASALELLRVWEYTGRVRRGYFVEGLSGAQFVRGKDFDGVTAALANPQADIVWLSAADPYQLWGRTLPHELGRDFICHAGSVVALRKGLPVAVFERQGHTLRVFDYEALPEALRIFTESYRKKRLYPSLKRLTVKQYPKEVARFLKDAGFSPVMLDFELYR